MAYREIAFDMAILSVKDAFDDGVKSRLSGKRRDECPLGRYPSKALYKAWIRGWEGGDLNIQAVEVETKTVEVSTRDVNAAAKAPKMFWPQDKPLPVSYKMPQLNPCPSCRAVQLWNGNKAVIVRSTTSDRTVAYIKCYHCGYVGKLPIEKY